MKLLNLPGRIARESDGAPVRHCGWFVVDRLGDDEVGAALVRIAEQCLVPQSGSCRVLPIKILRNGN